MHLLQLNPWTVIFTYPRQPGQIYAGGSHSFAPGMGSHSSLHLNQQGTYTWTPQVPGAVTHSVNLGGSPDQQSGFRRTSLTRS